MYGTVVHSERSKVMLETDFCPAGCAGAALWFGSEAHGMTQLAQDLCAHHVYIPMRGLIESHNLSVSVAILLSEACRQRGLSDRGTVV